ncbi:MAG: DNA polymerase III subunit [Oscillospiraceae bacterium]|nr:DNA polymerase III subunit [Oscillospiraceae bacterium]
MQFDGFLGNTAARRLLAPLIDSGRFPHAILMEGLPGSGRMTLAKLIAKAAVCTACSAEGYSAEGYSAEGYSAEGYSAEGARPCGVCSGCYKAENGIHPDITVAGGDRTARSFHIGAVRGLLEDAWLIPNEAPRRVFILAEAGAMTPEAQNALLKMLEEPPPRLMFILTCENRSELLTTVQSRLLTVALAGVSAEEGLPFLRERLPDLPPDKLAAALTLFDGRLGQVLEALGEEDTFSRIGEIARALAEGIAAGGEWALMKATGPLAAAKGGDRALIDGVLAQLLLILRDALALYAGAAVSTAPETARLLVNRLGARQLMHAVTTVQQLQRDRLYNMNQTLLVSLLCSRMHA